jgi:hypothetical protein
MAEKKDKRPNQPGLFRRGFMQKSKGGVFFVQSFFLGTKKIILKKQFIRKD